MESAGCDVAIVGAGPYALAAAAHLRGTTSLDVCVFGRPMSFWQECMPEGMYLRSPYVATNIASPGDAFGLDAFRHATGVDVPAPTPLSRFVEYGQWVQAQVAPDGDPRLVESIERIDDGFELALEGGTRVDAARVVVAAGIAKFAYVPETFADIDPALASHASAWRDFAPLAGKRVVVIGGGQTALESAALLHEIGARVELLVRAPEIHWLHGSRHSAPARALVRLLSGPSEIGPPGISRLVEAPKLFTAVPRRVQSRLHQRAILPAGASWLRPRVDGVVPVSFGATVREVQPGGDTVQLTLDDGTTRETDHVLLGTGYRVDVAGYPFLSRSVLSAIRRVRGYPVLGAGFESSVPGLHFLGAPAAYSYGPLLRFVAGTEYAAPALARHAQRGVVRRPTTV